MRSHTNTTNRLWSALESLVGLSALPAEWEAAAGDGYSSLRPFLKPDGRVAASLPYLPSRGWAVPNHVVHRGDDRYVGVIADGLPCDLRREDVAYLRLDLRRLQRAICDATGLTAAPLREEIAAHLWQIATINAGAGMSLSVYLACAAEPADLDRVIATLITRGDSLFLLITPTSDCYTPESRHVLTSRAAEHIALNDLMEMDDVGAMRTCMPIDEVVRRLQLATLARNDSQCAEPYVFRRDGNVWEVAFNGNRKPVMAIKGMTYIHEVLSHPYKHVHVIDLSSIGAGVEVCPPRGADDPIDDGARRKTMERRATELQEELDAARERCDHGAQERILKEMDRLAVYEKAAGALNRRKRQSADDGERCRVAARKAFMAAIAAIRDVHPALAKYLKAHIRTGYEFQYVPEQELPWAL